MSERFLNAYYYSFDATGCDPVDAILEAVARAGKGSHHTDGWSEYGHTGKIQATAVEAADRLERTEARVAELESALKEVTQADLPDRDNLAWREVVQNIKVIARTALANTTPAKLKDE